MSNRAYRVDCLYRYRPAPIRAAFVPCHRDVHFRVNCRHWIWRDRVATRYLSDGVIWMTYRIVTSRHRATIQIPIAMRSTLTPSQCPAVSSLEAYPTPAH